jgi:PHD/YefM family antitoxin component YafN of YafNO toxin-antitoxin module
LTGKQYEKWYNYYTILYNTGIMEALYMAHVITERHVKKVTSEEVRDQLADITDRVAFNSERLIMTRRGKEMMALVSIEDFELLERVIDMLQDREELSVIKQRLATYEETGESISLEEFEAQLLA